MALQAIKPTYKKWVASKTNVPTDQLFSDLEKKFSSLNDDILEGRSSDKQLASQVSDIRSKMLYASLLYSRQKLQDPDKDWSDEDKVFDTLENNLKYINTYEDTKVLRQQKSNINILTWVNTIFLPLTLIVGFYGMNFGSMGAPARGKGPFTMRHGQLWVFFLFAVAILATLGVLVLIRKASISLPY